MKRFICLLAAALLLAALAVPAFAEPEPETVVEGATLEPISPREFAPIVPYEDQTTAFEVTTEQTIVGIVPIQDDELFVENDPLTTAPAAPVVPADMLTYGALGLSLLALLLAVIALARSGKRPGKNATGNYKKYF